MQALRSSFRFDLIESPVGNESDVERAITATGSRPAAGLIVLPDSFLNSRRDLIVALTARRRLPAIYALSEFTRSGGLIAYGIERTDLFRRAASYVDRILKGEKPADLPVQQPTKFELVINLKTARAQQPAKLPTVGYLGGGGPASQRAWVDAFVQRLRDLGWIEGRTVAIEYRWGEGRAERYAEIAAEFVRLKVDVILAGGTEPAIAAKQATSVIPIVFLTAGDPVGSGLVASLARPGGNVTGLSNQASDLPAKRLEILREVFPDLRRLGVMANAAYSGGVTERDEIEVAARTFGPNSSIRS